MPAAAFEQDLGHLADHAFLGSGGMFDADAAAGQTRDLAAINADEVRMLAGHFASGSPHFKSPNMISQLNSGEDPSVSQLDQVAIDGRPVKTLGGQKIRNLGMAQRTGRSDEFPHHRNTSRGSAQTDGANLLADQIEWGWLRGTPGHNRELVEQWATSQS